MPILPFIDLLILAGWTALFGGFLLKLISLTTAYRPTLFGIGPLDLLIVAGVFMLLALTLSARTWVKAHEQEKAVYVWTVNDEAEMRLLLDWGVNGLITDRPDILKRVLLDRGEWTGSA